jgi:hypothetical protein
MGTGISSLDDDGLGRRLRALGAGATGDGVSWMGHGPAIVDGSIVLDSHVGGLEAMRSAGTLEQRQLVIQAGDATVVIDLAPYDDGFRASGQALGFDLPAAVQFVDQAGEEVALVVTDDLGEFEAFVPAGELLMIIATANSEVVVPLSISN